MPQLDAFSWLLWGLTIGLQLGLAVVLIVCRCYPRWIAVCVFGWFNAVTSLFLLAAYLGAFGYDSAPAIYFYGFWTKQAINSGLQLWILVEIGCNVAPALTRILRRLIPAVAGVYLIGALYIVGTASLNFPRLETRVAISLDRVTSLAWIALFLCFVYTADALGVRWSRQNIGVAIGFALISNAETGSGWLFGEFSNWYWISNARSVVWQAGVIAWTITFLRFDSPDEGNRDPGEILSFLDMLKKVLVSKRPK